MGSDTCFGVNVSRRAFQGAVPERTTLPLIIRSALKTLLGHFATLRVVLCIRAWPGFPESLVRRENSPVV